MTNPFAITRGEKPSEDAAFLEDRLYEHNAGQTGHDDGQLFSFIIRGEQGVISAGLAGWTWAEACEIKTLWVDASLRGQGCGSALLQAAEQEARARGCRVILINSYSFQAPGFYQKHGYELAYTLEDFPPGHSYSYLIKRLE